jgi:hypothetical protein
LSGGISPQCMEPDVCHRVNCCAQGSGSTDLALPGFLFVYAPTDKGPGVWRTFHPIELRPQRWTDDSPKSERNRLRWRAASLRTYPKERAT